MSQKYRTLCVKNEITELLSDCEFVYREVHPEFNMVPLSKSKILYEVLKFYLKGTSRDLKYKEGLV